jgi:hypothetical protein
VANDSSSLPASRDLVTVLDRHVGGAGLTPHPAPAWSRAMTATMPAPWDLLCPVGTLSLDSRYDERGALRRRLEELPQGTAVSLVDDRPLSRWRLRRLARQAGIVIDRELVVLPHCSRPLAVVDDVESAVRHFWLGLATGPDGSAAHRARSPRGVGVRLLLRVAPRLPWAWTGAVATGRVVVGRRR